jgi:hypothetical protein
MKLFLLGSLPKTPISSLPAGTASVLTETEFSCRNVFCRTTRRNLLSASLFQVVQNSFPSLSLSLEGREDSAYPHWVVMW